MRVIILLLAAALCCGGAYAQVPHQINYQGYLTNPGGTPVNNAGLPMVLKLYDVSAAGTALHSETQTVPVSNGVFNVLIGAQPANPLVLPFDKPYYLGVTVGGDSEMTPRQAVAAVGYAIRAASLDSAATVSAAQITGVISPTNLGSTQQLPTVPCVADQIAKWGASTWVCANAALPDASGNLAVSGMLRGAGTSNHAVRGDSTGNIAVLGINGAAVSDVGGIGGVYGISNTGFGVGGESNSGDGIVGSSATGYAGHFYGNVLVGGTVSATFAAGHAIRGDSTGNIAVLGINGAAVSDVGGIGGVYGVSKTGFGVGGESTSGDGVLGSSQTGYAGHFYGKVLATGTLSATAANFASAVTGGWNSPVLYVENQNAGAGTSPALRVVANGTAVDGALSVSNQGSGLIARFGNTSAWVAQLDLNGNWSATSFVPTSDRNVKQNFKSINVREILDKVAALPITRWNFKTDAAIDHLGPMAQDFYAAFGVGPDDKHIATVDADGVALAAIQGLNAKLEEQTAALRVQIDEKDARLAAQAARIAELERDRHVQVARIESLETQAAEIADLRQQVANLTGLQHQSTDIAQSARTMEAAKLAVAK